MFIYLFIMADWSIYYYIIRDVLALLWKYIFPHPCSSLNVEDTTTTSHQPSSGRLAINHDTHSMTPPPPPSLAAGCALLFFARGGRGRPGAGAICPRSDF